MRLIDDRLDLSAYLEPANPGVNVVPASRFFEEVRDEFLNPSETQGARTPWPKVDACIRFRDSEVSLWSGANGSGKSLVTSQVALGLCQQDERVCIASFEMPPRKTMKRMTRQASAGPEPTLDFIKKFHRWTDDRLWIFNHLGTIAPETVIATARYCADKLKIKHFFIDSLMRCVRGEDDYNGQKDFVTDLCSVAQETGQHIYLVHHTKKPPDDSHKPSRFDAKGSGAISDNVDNAFNVWRNWAKERDLDRDTFKDEQEREKAKGSPDTLVICDKNRHGEWDGTIALWFDRGSLSFRGDQRLRHTGMDL